MQLNNDRQNQTLRIRIFDIFIILLCIYGLAEGVSNAGKPKNKNEPLVSSQSQPGKYETVDFVLEYKYAFQPKAGQASEMIFNGSLRRKGKLDSLDIWITFLDESGKRLKRYNVFGSGAGRGVANRSFEVKFKVPPGANQFEFTSISREKRDVF